MPDLEATFAAVLTEHQRAYNGCLCGKQAPHSDDYRAHVAAQLAAAVKESEEK